MQQLQHEQPSTYKELVDHMQSYYYGRWARTPYSAAMDKVQAKRGTKNSRIQFSKNLRFFEKGSVGSKLPDAKRLFIELTSYMLDLNVILDILLSEDKTFCVLAGLAHIVRRVFPMT